MPVLIIHTNLSKANFVNGEAVIALSKVATKLSGKPEEFISVLLNADAIMTFAGTTEPTALVEFLTLNGFSDNEAVIAELTEAIVKHIGVPKNRFFIKLNSAAANQIGFNGISIEKALNSS